MTFSIETLPDLSSGSQRLLRRIEVVTVVVFSIEYVLRLVAAPRRLAYVFSFYGLVDLLAILPFYVGSGVDLRSVRIFRLFRLFRIFRITRLSNALARFGHAFMSIGDEIMVFFMATALLLYVSAVGIYYFENPAQPDQFSSVFTSLWWAVITLTTVGYGDVYPVTVGGRIFTFVVLMIGLGVIAVPTGLISSALGASIAAKHEARGAHSKTKA